MEGLVRQRQAPRNAFIPKPIDVQRLFALDVDDDIWEDAGLDDEDGVIPPWLGDNNVRKGIRSVLMLDRCVEEEHRLVNERASMQLWMHEEWETVQRAIAMNGTVVASLAKVLFICATQ
jgi:hypothetical protein